MAAVLSTIQDDLGALRTAMVAASNGGDTPRFLFRGQTARYQQATSFISRPNLSVVERGQAYTALQRATFLRTQLKQSLPLPLDESHVLALLQHYGWPTPYLDLTDSPDVAVFFALAGYRGPGPAVVYVVDTAQLPQGCSLVAHEDLMDFPGYAQMNLRWQKQRAWALAANGWPDMLNVKSVDLEDARYAAATSCILYTPGDLDDAGVGDLMRLGNLEIAERLQSQMTILCRGLFQNELHRNLRQALWAMYPL